MDLAFQPPQRRAFQSSWRAERLLPLLLLLASAALLLAWRPSGFTGGSTDDQRYLEAAQAWVAHWPFVGTRHWDLRHSLVLPLAGWLRLSGDSLRPFVLIPAAYYLGTLAIAVPSLGRWLGERAALLAAALFATTPLLHDLGTRIYPEIAELFFATASLAALGRAAARGSRVMALLSGAMLALAMLTRETSYWLALIYALVFIADWPVPRATMLWVAAGAMPLLFAETAWLWLATGDPLYRAHVDMAHVTIPSGQMIGGTYHGDHILFSGDLARHWVPAGPVRIHWTVNPILNLFAVAAYGAVFWLVLLLGVMLVRSPRRLDRAAQRAILMLAALGVVSFAFSTYVLIVSQQPRYYAMPVACAAVIAAVLIDRLLLARGRRGLAMALLALQALVFFVVVDIGKSDAEAAQLSIALLHGVREPVHGDPRDVARLRYPLRVARQPDRLLPMPTPVGGLRLYRLHPRTSTRDPRDPDPACCWRVERRMATPEAIVRTLLLATGLKHRHPDTRVGRVALELRRRIS